MALHLVVGKGPVGTTTADLLAARASAPAGPAPRSRALGRPQQDVALAAEGQLDHALRGQVNPHFLFNSFNSLRALIASDIAAYTPLVREGRVQRM